MVAGLPAEAITELAERAQYASFKLRQAWKELSCAEFDVSPVLECGDGETIYEFELSHIGLTGVIEVLERILKERTQQ